MPSGRITFTNIKDKKIAIFRSKNEKDEYGEVTSTWEPISPKLWACYRSLSGNQIYAAMTAGFEEDCVFTVNWNSGIVPGLHVVFRDKAYEITRVDDLEGYKKDMKLTCKWLPLANLEEYPRV